MPESSFKEILHRYLHQKASEQEIRMVEAWFDLLADEGSAEQLHDAEMAQLYDRIRSNPVFGELAPVADLKRTGLVRNLGRGWKVAAVCAGILLMASLLYILLKPFNNGSAIAFKDEFTTKGEVKKIILPDNSIVWMNANTHLAYHPDFASHREIKLDGEAMFEVTPEQEHPFTVLTTDSIQTKVLGTRFNISSYAQEARTSITVLEGRVSVTRNQVNMGILKKQEGIEYNAAGNDYLPLKINDVNRIEGWIKGQWEFDSLDIAGLNRLLINQYGITVINKRPELSGIKVSSNFNRQQQAEDIVKIFCLLADCSYKWIDKTTIEVY